MYSTLLGVSCTIHDARTTHLLPFTFTKPLLRRYLTGKPPLLRRFLTGTPPLLHRYLTGTPPLLRRYLTGKPPLLRRYLTGTPPVFVDSAGLCWQLIVLTVLSGAIFNVKHNVY